MSPAERNYDIYNKELVTVRQGGQGVGAVTG